MVKLLASEHLPILLDNEGDSTLAGDADMPTLVSNEDGSTLVDNST